MNIALRGPIGRAIILVMAVFGFVLALGDVLDVYDAFWKFTTPLTVVYAGLIWRFALAPAEGEFVPKAGWALAFYLVMKLLMTIALLLVTLGVIALGYDIFLLIAHNWHYVLIALVIIALVVGWAMLPERKTTRKRGAAAGRPARPVGGKRANRPGRDDLVS